MVWVLICVSYSAQAQYYLDGPIEVQMKVRDIEVRYASNSSSDFNLNIGSLGLSNFEDDELTFRFWARDAANISGSWQLVNCLQANLQMNNGGPDYTPDYNQVVYSYTYPTNSVPVDLELAMWAWEDDVPTDFAIVSGLTPCGSTGSRCSYETNICCLSVGGCLFTEGDDYWCEAGPIHPFLRGINYRYDTVTNQQISPCVWFARTYQTGTCPARNYYKPTIETYWRYTKGYGCNNAIDLGLFSSGSTIINFNNNTCYNNTWPSSPGNDVTYSFTINQPIGINANLCGVNGAQFDSYLYLLNSNCTVEESNDNGCGNQSTVSTYLCQPGTYYLVVDATAANQVGTFTLTLQEDSTFTLRMNLTKTDVQCFGAADGTISSTVTGGFSPYTYLWSNGETTDSIGSLGPGNYCLTVTDYKGCTISDCITITEPTQLTSTTSVTNVSCSGAADGTATVNPAGGTAPYSFIWGSRPFQVTQTAEFLTNGTYYVTVIDDNNCIIVDSATVGTNTVIVVNLDSLHDVSCFGAGDGFIDLSISGGRSPYTFNWSTTETTEDIANLGPGQYNVTVYDADSCFIADSFMVAEPPLLTADIDDTINVRCNGGLDGIITTTIGGGTPPYTYLWSNGRTSQNLLNVPAGPYGFTVTDYNGCEAYITHTITEPPPLSLQWNLTNPSCAGDSSGAIDITLTGGTPPVTYLWTTNDTTEDLTNVPAGAYGVLVTDSFNCFLFEFNTLTDNPPLVVTVGAVVDVDCNSSASGSIQLTVTGGVPAYTFNWSDPMATGQNPSNLPAGTYTVTVTDQNNCTDVASATINEPTAISASVFNVTNVSCNGYTDGGIDVDITGGTPPYTYLWSNNATTEDLSGVGAGNYTLLITDANGCPFGVQNTVVTEPAVLTSSLTKVDPSCSGAANGSATATANGGTPPYSYLWSTGGTTATINNLAGGTYTVLITDNHNCFITDTITLISAGAITAVPTITDVTCFGAANGSIDLAVTGGFAPYLYTWAPAGSGNTNPLTGLSGGQYDLTITDDIGCTATFSYFVDEPDSMILELIPTNVLCYGDASGIASPIINGGSPSYTFDWSDGQQSQVATGLNPGTISLTVTDGHGCTATNSVVIQGPDSFAVQATQVTNVTCNGGSDGGVILNVSGGTADYLYAVDNLNFQSTGDFTGLEAGTYTAFVLDANNCSATASFTVTEPDEWSVTFAEPYVFTARGGSVDLEPQIVGSGIVPATYSWSPADGLDCTDCAQVSATPIETTTYTVTITDTSGCVQEGQVAVVVKNGYEVFMPNAFSPNGDGLNDTWIPLDYGSIKTIDLKIFNRWGSMVFNTQTVGQGWDGTFKGEALTPDTYIYYMVGTYQDGSEFSETGSIALVR